MVVVAQAARNFVSAVVGARTALPFGRAAVDAFRLEALVVFAVFSHWAGRTFNE